MLTERLTFRTKYGHGDDLVALMKEMNATMASMRGAPTTSRLYTDATGPMFSVILENDYADLKAFAAASTDDPETYANPDFRTFFERMQAVTEYGERQLLNMEVLS